MILFLVIFMLCAFDAHHVCFNALFSAQTTELVKEIQEESFGATRYRDTVWVGGMGKILVFNSLVSALSASCSFSSFFLFLVFFFFFIQYLLTDAFTAPRAHRHSRRSPR